MFYGDYDLEFLHLNSCHSLCEENWGDPYWPTAFGGLQELNGFHGVVDSGFVFGIVAEMEDLADDGFHMSLADAWLDNFYALDVIDVEGEFPDFEINFYDRCPVTMVAGRNETSAETRLAGL